jgi:tRNA(Ile)-lysidine synthetase-like protein
VVREQEDSVVLETSPLLAYYSVIATRVLRGVLRRFGTVLDRPGTRTALQFISTARSGRTLQLAGGRAQIQVEFGQARVSASRIADPDVPVRVEGTEGRREGSIGGRTLRVAWRSGADAREDEAALDPAGAPFTVRGWRPGDRIRTAAGGRTLKKQFNQSRVPRSQRFRIPVVQDASGRVVWVVGVAGPPSRVDGPALLLSIVDA